MILGMEMSVSEILQGRNGKSAYELAVSKGFPGTLDEWLESLKGQDGSGAPIVQELGSSESAVLSQKAATDAISAIVVPTKTSQLENDSDFVTSDAIPKKLTDLQNDLDFDVSPGRYPTATSELENDSGFITSADIPTKLSQFENDSEFLVANDLPTVPTKLSELTNDANFATTSDLPTKTSVLTNDSGFITAASIPEIPTNISAFNNDAGYITSSAVPTKTSLLTNDSGFITSASLPEPQEIVQTLGDSETAALSQKASSTLLAAKEHNHSVSQFSNSFFVNAVTKLDNTWHRIQSIPTSNGQALAMLGRSSVDNSIHYLQTYNGQNLLEYPIVTKDSSYWHLTYKGNQLYVLSNDTVYIANADNPNSWQALSIVTKFDCLNVTYFTYIDGSFFVCGAGTVSEPSTTQPVNGLWKSSDSLNWELVSETNGNCYYFTHNNDAYYLCSEDGIYRSADLATWANVLSTETSGAIVKNILVTDDSLVAHATGSKFFVSTDGTSWEEKTSAQQYGEHFIWDESNKLFYANAIDTHEIFTSKDLVNWTSFNSFSENILSLLCWNGGISFVVSNSESKIKVITHNENFPFLLLPENGGTGVTSLSELKKSLQVPTSTNDLENNSGFITQDDIPEIPTVPTKLSAFENDSNYAKTSQLPTKTSVLTNDSGFITQEDIPDIPTKLSQLENDSSYAKTSQLPTKTSVLTNDSEFITAADIPTIPTKTSQLTNDSGFITSSSIPTNVSTFQNDANYATTGAVEAVSNRVGELEATIGTLNDELESALNGN